MLSSWAWAAAVIDGSAAVGRRRNVLRVQDELWRALRVAPGLVERSDRVTRLGRHRGEVSVQVTHSLDDLEALPTEADRAKARGLAARNGILVLGGMADQRTRRHRSDHPADRAGSGDGAVLGRPTDLGHRNPPPRPRQVPDQVRGAGRACRCRCHWSRPNDGSTTPTRPGTPPPRPTRPGPARRRRRVRGDRAEPGTAAPDRDRRPAGPARNPRRRHGRDDRDLGGDLGGGVAVRRRHGARLGRRDGGGAGRGDPAGEPGPADRRPRLPGAVLDRRRRADRPGARRRRRGDLVVRRPRPVRDRGAVAGPPPRRARHGRARARSAARCSCGPHCSRPPRVAGPRGRAAARGWTRARWGCGWVGSAATTCTPARKTCSWRSPGRGRTRPPPWWCPRCCPRSGRW